MGQRKNTYQDDRFKPNYINYIKCKRSKHPNLKAEIIKLKIKERPNYMWPEKDLL